MKRFTPAKGDNSFRVGTLNVLGLSHQETTSQLLEDVGVSVVGFQEVSCHWHNTAMQSLCKSLKMKCEWTNKQSCGNAVASRPKILKATTFKLGNYRTAVACELKCPLSQHIFGFVCTHLDHVYEPKRVQQMVMLKRELDNLWGDEFPHIMVGDFNALNVTDYSDARLREITDVRARTRWELPQSELMEYIAQIGYHDLCVEGLTNSDGTPCDSLNGSTRSTGTCRYDTRIDYLFANDAFLNQYRVVPGSYQVVGECNSFQTGSDHSLVTVDIQRRK
eukprot:GFYU01000657.1.p1 GENE.GFYU01000657.1~~GFYU01000657.1.p1  ORF type:complete len:277 (+),score=25.91 GFYU01000657.1:36-866(+)